MADARETDAVEDENHERGAESLREVSPAVAERYGLTDARETEIATHRCAGCGHYSVVTPGHYGWCTPALIAEGGDRG